MSRKKRLILQTVIVLAMSTIALAAIKRAHEERRSAPPARNVPESSRSAAEKAPERAEPERPQQQPADRAQKQHVTVSPDRRRVVYHLPFDPYKAAPEPVVFVVAQNETGSPLREIPLNWRGRYVGSVDWLNEQTVAVQGDGYLAVLDVEAGKPVQYLRGSAFAVSPDGTRIVFTHDFNPRYGFIPPEYESDYVLFSPLDRRQATFNPTDNQSSFTNYKIVYPESRPWGRAERKAYENLYERHQIKSAFAWSPDSRKVAFVEKYRQKLWLVVLWPKVADAELNVDVQSFELTDTDKTINSVSWEGSDTQVRVGGDGISWLVDTQARTVLPVP